MKKSVLTVAFIAFAFAAVVVWLQRREPAVETGARMESARMSERPNGSSKARNRLPALRPAAAERLPAVAANERLLAAMRALPREGLVSNGVG